MDASTIDPLNVAVEVLCTTMVRVARTSQLPSYVRQALQDDVAEHGVVPDRYMCEMLVEVANDQCEQRWFAARWPRTLGMVTATLHG
jgi:hypothetical protein